MRYTLTLAMTEEEYEVLKMSLSYASANWYDVQDACDSTIPDDVVGTLEAKIYAR